MAALHVQFPTYEVEMYHLRVVQWPRYYHNWMVIDAVLHSTLSMRSPDRTLWQIFH